VSASFRFACSPVAPTLACLRQRDHKDSLGGMPQDERRGHASTDGGGRDYELAVGVLTGEETCFISVLR